MGNRFDMRRALSRLLASTLPIGQRFLHQTRLGVVVRQQLGLYRRHLSKLPLQGLSNPLVIVLTRAPQQRGIGRLLDQCMLEDIRGLCAYTPLVQQFGVDEAPQILA